MSDEVTTFFPSKTIVPFPAPETPEHPGREEPKEASGARARQALKRAGFEPEGGIVATVERATAAEDSARVGGKRGKRDERDHEVVAIAPIEKDPALEPREAKRDEPAASRPPARKDLPVLLAKAPAKQPDPARVATTMKITPATLGDLRRTIRQLGSPGTLALFAAGALAVIFALGMVVGRIVTFASASKSQTVAVEPAQADPAAPVDSKGENAVATSAGGAAAAAPAIEESSEAQNDESAVGTRELETPKADEPERTKELAVVTVDPVKPAARRPPPARAPRRGGDRAATPSKRATVAKNGGGSSSPPSPAKAPSDASQTNAEDLKAASAADELARRQLEAAMK